MLNPYSPPRTDPAAEPVLEEQHDQVMLASTVITLGLVVPGLPSILMKRQWTGLLILISIPAAFAFFGPIWGEYIFDGTPYREHGLYPFLCVLGFTPIVSVVHGLRTRRKRIEEQPLSPEHPSES